jgi:hypothetical protein
MASEEANYRAFLQPLSVKQHKKQNQFMHNQFICNSFYITAFRYTNELSCRAHDHYSFGDSWYSLLKQLILLTDVSRTDTEWRHGGDIDCFVCIAVRLWLSDMMWQWRLELSRDNTKYPIDVDARCQLTFRTVKLKASPAFNPLRAEKVKVCIFLYPMVFHFRKNFTFRKVVRLRTFVLLVTATRR